MVVPCFAFNHVHTLDRPPPQSERAPTPNSKKVLLKITSSCAVTFFKTFIAKTLSLSTPLFFRTRNTFFGSNREVGKGE